MERRHPSSLVRSIISLEPPTRTLNRGELSERALPVLTGWYRMRQVTFHRSQPEISMTGCPGTVATSAVSFPMKAVRFWLAFNVYCVPDE